MRTVFDTILKYALLRAILLIVLGVLVILAPETVMHVIAYVLAAGVLVLGVVHIISALRTREQGIMSYDMIVGLLLLVLAAVLLLFTRTVISMLPIFLGALLVIGGVSSLLQAIRYSKAIGKFNIILIIVHVLIIAGGVLVIANPFASAVVLFRVFGIVAVVMGLADLVSYFVYRKADQG